MRYSRACAWRLAASWLFLPLAALADAERGLELSITHCARCHVIGDYNRLGGIGSTPSFMALTGVPDYALRVKTFYTRHPHPVFVRVPGYERWSLAPPYAPEFEIRVEDIDHILDYVRTLEDWQPPARRR